MATRLSPRRPADTGDEDVQPVSMVDEAAIYWLRQQGIDPRDYTFGERVQMWRNRDVQGTSANPGGYGPEHDNPIPYRPTPESAARVERMRQSIEGQLGGGYPPLDRMRGQERTPEWYDREYGPWGSVIRSLEGGQDWGPYRRLEAMRRLEALGPDVVADYGPGWDPTADSQDDFSGDSVEPNYNPEEGDGSPWAPLLESGAGSQADAMPLPFLEPRTDEERTNDQLMEADRARWQGGGRQPPSAARRFGVTPPPLRMTTAAAEMPGPNTAMQSSVPSEGDRPPFPPEWDVNNPEHRQRHFEDVYKSLLDDLLSSFPGATNPEGGAATYEDLPRVGPGSGYSQGRDVVRPGDVGLPSFWENSDLSTGDRAGQARSEWLRQHPEYQIAPDFTDETDYPIDIPAEGEPGNRRGENGFGWRSGYFGGDETDRYWAGPQASVSKNDQGRLAEGGSTNRKPELPGPNTAMSSLPTGDTDMRPWWLRLLDTTSGGPAAHGPDVNFPPLGASPSGNVTPLYDWEDPETPGPNTFAMGDGQVRSLDQYRQQRAQAQHPAGTGGWADLLDSQLGTGPSESAGGFQSLADIAKQMGLDPDAAVTSLDEWRNRGNVGEQLPLFDPNSTMSGNGAVPRGLGGFQSRYRPQPLGGFQPARPMAPLGGFGRPHSLPPMGGYGSRGAGIPSSTNFSMQRHFNKPHREPFDGLLENVERNTGKILVGTAAGIGGAALLAAGAAGRLLSPFGG